MRGRRPPSVPPPFTRVVDLIWVTVLSHGLGQAAVVAALTDRVGGTTGRTVGGFVESSHGRTRRQEGADQRDWFRCIDSVMMASFSAKVYGKRSAENRKRKKAEATA